MICPFICVNFFSEAKEDFVCPCEDRLENPNDNFSCEDCPHYQSIQKCSY